MYTMLYRLLCGSCWLFGVDADDCRREHAKREVYRAPVGRESFGH